MVAMLREQRLQTLADRRFDVVIAGGGISGAAIFARLARSGYRVLLIDKGDFGSCTSQESAMMIWGGLLYLTRFDFKTVYTLSRNRDQLLARYPEAVRPQYFRYFPLKSGWQTTPLVKGVLDFYRALGGFRRRRNFVEPDFSEKKLVTMSRYRGSVAYEEAVLTTSDARFVLDLIRGHDSPASVPLNYVSLEEGHYDRSHRLWVLALHDQFDGGEFEVRARLVINAAGPQVDQLNQHFAIGSPYKHIFSKGVFLSFARPPGHDAPLIFELGQNRDVLSFIPWGPVSCWGPTETAIQELAGAGEPQEADVQFLLEQASRSLSYPVTREAIVAYRSGVRPLAVAADYHAERYPLELSRHHRIHVDKAHAWMAVYGGKFTSAFSLADTVDAHVEELLGRPRQPPPVLPLTQGASCDMDFPGLAVKFPSLSHCVEHEYCLTISDYLRRRTNIAQWVARNGLGNSRENLPFIKQLAGQLPRAKSPNFDYSLEHYVNETQRVFDRLQGIGGR